MVSDSWKVLYGSEEEEFTGFTMEGMSVTSMISLHKHIIIMYNITTRKCCSIGQAKVSFASAVLHYCANSLRYVARCAFILHCRISHWEDI